MEMVVALQDATRRCITLVASQYGAASIDGSMASNESSTSSKARGSAREEAEHHGRLITAVSVWLLCWFRDGFQGSGWLPLVQVSG